MTNISHWNEWPPHRSICSAFVLDDFVHDVDLYMCANECIGLQKERIAYCCAVSYVQCNGTALYSIVHSLQITIGDILRTKNNEKNKYRYKNGLHASQSETFFASCMHGRQHTQAKIASTNVKKNEPKHAQHTTILQMWVKWVFHVTKKWKKKTTLTTVMRLFIARPAPLYRACVALEMSEQNG